ncbi:hypothetical protein KDK95_25680 [Actinospica sp. MGRD01-02]|uniref:Uncharacterized protein n=1 Tax=Actinospica acidithermotolerans TaxID=2828514 RepID=A0A941IM67_9ACTN|nr:hypothetical protein [Actinospica acidithermotolerans]MBR7829723.1 hypothetical protein [Actinospica acidithermotolerans]
MPDAPARPVVLTGVDVVQAVRDGLVGLVAAYVAALIAMVLVVTVGFHGEQVNAGVGDYLASAAWLTASSLGTPISGTMTGADSGISMSIGISLRVTVWLLTIIVLYIVYRAVRGRERTAPSVTLGQLVARSALTAAVVSIALLILSFATHRADPFGGTGYLTATSANDGVQGVGGSMSIDAPLVFVGPLLLVFVTALVARLGVWIHLMSADPRAARVRTQLGLWAPSFRVAWLQTRVIGALVGVGLWIYAVFEVVSNHELSHGGLAALIGGLFLLPNFAIYGTFVGFGVTLYASAAGLSSLGGLSSSGSDGGTGATDGPGGSGYDFGLFAGHRPWGVWLLLLAVIIGTSAPALLARRGTARFAVDRADYTPNGAWRSVLLGGVAALAITLLGTLALTMNAGLEGVGVLSVTESFGPSLLAAVGLTALWFLLSYLVLSFSLGHRIQAATGAATGPAVSQGYAAATFASSPTTPTVPQQSMPQQSMPEPTLQFAEPSTTAPVYQPSYGYPSATQPLPAPASGRGLRPKVAIPLVLVLILGVGGYLAYQHFVGDQPSGAQGAVNSYFQDIEAGNASAASALATGPYQETPLVGASTIANAANRPSGFTIVSSAAVPSTAQSQYRQEGVTGNNLTYVAVKYNVHGTELSDTYLAEQVATTGQWVLVDPYRVLSVSGGWSSTVIVDGMSVTEQSSVEVFPGAHVVADPSTPDFSAVSDTAYPTEGSTYAQYTWTELSAVTLPAASLTAQGQSAVQAAYSAALSQCATDAETGYGACGINNTYNYYTCNNVTWTITTVGTVSVDLSTQNSDGSYDFTATGSVASETGDYTDFDGADQTFSNQTTDLEDSTGSISFNSDGSATATLTS